MLEPETNRRISNIEETLDEVQRKLNAEEARANQSGEMTDSLRRDFQERQLALNVTRRKLEHVISYRP